MNGQRPEGVLDPFTLHTRQLGNGLLHMAAGCARALQCEVRPELVVLLMLKSVACFILPQRLQPLVTTVGVTTNGLARCRQRRST